MQRELFSLIRESINQRDEMLRRLQQQSLPVAIYGAGLFAFYCAEYLLGHGLKVFCFFVDDEYLTSKNIFVANNNINIIPLSELQLVKEKFNVVVGFNNYSAVSHVLDNKETLFPQASLVVYMDAQPSHSFSYEYYHSHKHEYERAYGLLEDDLSKKIFAAHINSKICGNPLNLCEYWEQNKWEYDYELIGIGKSEVFVDCGAYTGDTIIEFIEYVNNRYRKIYAFEPDDRNFIELTEATKQLRNIELINNGVYEANAELTFKVDSFNNMSSSVSTFGDVVVSVVSLDHVLQNEDVSFIKMDIEGSELSALKGAENIILRCMPKMAICVYHNHEDLYSIPIYLETINELFQLPKRYKFYLRQHSPSMDETVLYAIPG